MDPILQTIRRHGLVPVVKLDDPGQAVALGRAFLAGGLPLAEITFRAAGADQAIAALSAEVPELLVGAGTVLTVEQAQAALKAGARFIVAPGFNPRVVDYCLERGVPVTPGVNNPSQVEAALEKGLEVLKFFPAEASGGLAMLKALAAPFGGVRFIPTGGIDAANLGRYLALEAVLACGGTWLAPAGLIAAGKFEEIIRLVRQAVAAVHGFEFGHLGLHFDGQEPLAQALGLLAEAFHLPAKATSSSVFAGPALELTATPPVATPGHLALAVNDVERALAYLEERGIKVNPATIKRQGGRIKAVYLDRGLAGLALHLVAKGT